MNNILKNSTVTITYTGRLDNGEVFDTVSDKKPLTVTLGNSDLPPAIDSALIGQTVGSTLKVRVDPEESYGIRRKDLLQTVKRETLPKKIDAKVGLIISIPVEKDGQEQQIPATIVEVSNDNITVDYNHPLAGHHLNYNITILAIE